MLQIEGKAKTEKADGVAEEFLGIYFPLCMEYRLLIGRWSARYKINIVDGTAVNFISIYFICKDRQNLSIIADEKFFG